MWLWLWFILAVVAAIGEILTFDLFLAAIAAAAVITGVATLLLPIELQVGLFAGLSLGGIAFVRPAVKHALGIEARAQDARSLAGSGVTGQRAVVTQAVGSSTGQIRIGEGEFWTARSFDPSQTLGPGDVAEVVLIDGLIALVEPIRSGATRVIPAADLLTDTSTRAVSVPHEAGSIQSAPLYNPDIPLTNAKERKVATHHAKQR